jgi:hypothetical protein
MGAFDQFKDKADDVAEQAKGAMSGKRNKSAGSENPERAERGMPQEGQERRSEFEDQAQRRVGQESNEDQDDWA